MLAKYRLFIVLGAIIAFFFMIFYIYKEGENKGLNSCLINQKTNEIKVAKEIIETKKFQEKIVANNISSNNIMRSNWLQLIQKARANHN